jgi:carboxylesterase type B
MGKSHTISHEILLTPGTRGGFYEGSSRDDRYNLSRIVQKSVEATKPMIAVSINYRLSAFGFLWGKEVEEANGTANIGLRDQRLALHWIQENIAAFGGDPAKVTLWGESAGGIAIGRQLVAYGGRDDGLFRAAIMESGGPLERWPYAVSDAKAYTEELYNNLTISTGCNIATSPLECLRALPFADLNAALNITDTWIAGTGLGPWISVIDGDFLQDFQSTLMDEGKFVQVPILYGTNTDEGTAIGPAGINTDEEFRAALAAGGADNETITTIEYLYPNVPAIGVPLNYALTESDLETYGTQWKRIAAFFGDMVEHYPRRTTVQRFAAQNISAFSYRFNVLPYGLSPAIGVTHFQEIAWVFDNTDGVGYGSDPFNVTNFEAYEQVATLMTRMWASFVSDLDPNGHGRKSFLLFFSLKKGYDGRQRANEKQLLDIRHGQSMISPRKHWAITLCLMPMLLPMLRGMTGGFLGWRSWQPRQRSSGRSNLSGWENSK